MASSSGARSERTLTFTESEYKARLIAAYRKGCENTLRSRANGTPTLKGAAMHWLIDTLGVDRPTRARQVWNLNAAGPKFSDKTLRAAARSLGGVITRGANSTWTIKSPVSPEKVP